MNFCWLFLFPHNVQAGRKRGKNAKGKKKKLHPFSLCGKSKLNSQQDSWNNSNNWVMRYENTVGLSYPKVWSPRSHLVSREMLTHSNVFWCRCELTFWFGGMWTKIRPQHKDRVHFYITRVAHHTTEIFQPLFIFVPARVSSVSRRTATKSGSVPATHFHVDIWIIFLAVYL